MRTIKFRQLIWDYDDDKLLEWHYWGIVNGKFIEPIINGVNPENNYKSQQFTGLKDKNGKEIYEGDVVKSDVGLCEVEWIGSGLSLHTLPRESSRSIFSVNYHECEVIGNIFENPELTNP